MNQHDAHAAGRGPKGAFDVAAFDRPDAAWNRLAAATAHGDPFCCRTEWQLSFHEVFLPGRTLHARAGGGSMIAFAANAYPNLGPLLEPLESSWVFGCPLLGDRAVELLDDFVQEFDAQRPRPSVMLSGLLPRGALRAQVLRMFAPRYELLGLEPVELRRASLAGGLDGFLSRRSALFRRRLREAARRAAGRGVTFERAAPRSAEAAAAVYARMVAVERASWKGIGKCGMAEPQSLEFYGVLLRRLALAGMARVMFARSADADIGFIFGGVTAGIYRGQQFSFVDAWRPFSIGNLLQQEQIRWLGEEGAARYDMGPTMPYKLHWTEEPVRMDVWILRPKAGAR